MSRGCGSVPPPTGLIADGIAGRDEELHQLTNFLSAMASGPRILHISGEGGAGKTTLWDHGIELARQLGYQLLTLRCDEADERRPRVGLAELFGCHTNGDDTLISSATPAFDLGRMTLAALRRIAGVGAVLVAVDDQHWLDPESAGALRFAATRLCDERVGILLTTSPTRPHQAPLGLPYAQRLDLGPIQVEMLREVLAHVVTSISKPDLTRAHRLSNGNPGHALDLVRGWQRERKCGAVPQGREPAFPHPVNLSMLGEDAILVLKTLAVAGPSSAGVIAAAAGIDDLAHATRATVEMGLLQVTDDLIVQFVHARDARALLDAIKPLDRCAIHAGLAGAVVSPAARARHLALATVAPDEAIAGRIEMAAVHCADRGNPDLAGELAAHSVRLTPPARADTADRRLVREITYRAAAGETARALELADRALTGVPSGPRRAEILTQRVFLNFGESERFLRQALHDVGDDTAARGRVLDLLGWQLGIYQGRLAEGIASCTEALAIGDNLGDPEITALAGATLASIRSLSGQQCQDLFIRAMEAGAAANLSPLGRWPTVFWARQLMWAGHLRKARSIFVVMQREAFVRGSEFRRPYRLHDLASVDVAAGDLPAARQQSLDGIQAARDAGNEQAMAWLAHPLGLVAALQGDAGLARWAADLLSTWGEHNGEQPRHAMADEVLGNLAASQGDWPGALRCFAAMVGRLDEMGYRHPGARPGLPRAIEAAAMTGDTDRCQAYTERLAAQAASLDAPLVDAQLHAALGSVALLNGRYEDSVEHLGIAATDFDHCGYRFEAARVRLTLARAWLRCGQRAYARAAAGSAGEVFAAAECTGWLTAADHILERAGAERAGGSLTGTERQIATMVSTGRRNREIAAELFISPSTVEAHLTRIYRKLDLRGRAALTGWLHSMP
jgi:DNA-binding CsgD family transcriptional regulator